MIFHKSLHSSCSLIFSTLSVPQIKLYSYKEMFILYLNNKILIYWAPVLCWVECLDESSSWYLFYTVKKSPWSLHNFSNVMQLGRVGQRFETSSASLQRLFYVLFPHCYYASLSFRHLSIGKRMKKKITQLCGTSKSYFAFWHFRSPSSKIKISVIIKVTHCCRYLSLSWTM